MGNVELTGFASRWETTSQLSDGTSFLPFTVSTTSIRVYGIILGKKELTVPISPVRMTDKDDNSLACFQLITSAEDTFIMMDIPFLASNGLKFSVDTINGGDVITGVTTSVAVFFSNSGA